MLIPFLDLKIQLEVILTHKGRSRSCHIGQILEKRPGVQFFSQKPLRYVQLVVLGGFGDADIISGLKNSIRGHHDPQRSLKVTSQMSNLGKKGRGLVFLSKASQICLKSRFGGFWRY